MSTHVEVKQDKHNITFFTIETKSISSCHFILINEQLDEKPFGYLSHSCFIYQPTKTAEKTLVDLIKTIIKNIDSYNNRQEKESDESIVVNQMN
jgi:hypothetical protein